MKRKKKNQSGSVKWVTAIFILCLVCGPRIYNSYLQQEIDKTMEGWVMGDNPLTGQLEFNTQEYFDSLNLVHVNSFPKYEKTYYKNGNLDEEGEKLTIYRKDGVWKKYYDTGELWWTSNWENGIESGVQITYYKSGKVHWESNIINGKTEGLKKSYYENGQLRILYNYKNGKRVGLAKFYYENGQLQSEWDYRNGSTDGPIIGWTPYSKKCWDEYGNETECEE
tara:strand:+ start:488 stop:1156 length:669 start_codon:yes stop_codon:yes gene_type:complete